MAPMIRAASLRGFVPLVRALSGDPEDYLRRFGISAATLASDDGLIPITEHDLMLDAAAEELGCPDLGLRLAVCQDLAILGPLALAIESSATAAEALQCACRFMFVHSPALSVGVEPDPRGWRGVVALTYGKDLRESSYSPQATELGLGLFHQLAVRLVGGSTGLRSVEIPHQPLSPVHRYTEFFGADVKFGAPTAALRVEHQLLNARFASADAAVRQVAVEYLTRHYPDPGGRVSVRVRWALAESLGVAVPSLVHCARLLAMHPRTLQRRLAQEGTTYEEILDEVRREAAHRYLTTTDLPLGQIALLIGFTEQSTLSHAVHRWHGTSPRELRARARQHP
ncbi:AraC family transcriptional regulator [Kribbella catacumbae]|uniref:AraC family transcriptional regulator n=1 Tax=Kribbella catacumbae TaxID=460086 RepID=UPI000477089D|nr:AraC family transcriptional regulator [Kribbella catacumbae]